MVSMKILISLAATLVALTLEARAQPKSIDCEQIKSTTNPFQLSVYYQEISPTEPSSGSGIMQVYRKASGDTVSIVKLGDKPIATITRHGIFIIATSQDGRTTQVVYEGVDLSNFQMSQSQPFCLRSSQRETGCFEMKYEYLSTDFNQVGACKFKTIHYRTHDTMAVASVTTESEFAPELQASLRSSFKNHRRNTEQIIIARDITTSFLPLVEGAQNK